MLFCYRAARICHSYVIDICQHYITCNVYITENKMYYTVLLLSNDKYLYFYIDVLFNLLMCKLFSKFKGPLQISSFKPNSKHDFQDVERYRKYPLISDWKPNADLKRRKKILFILPSRTNIHMLRILIIYCRSDDIGTFRAQYWTFCTNILFLDTSRTRFDATHLMCLDVLLSQGFPSSFTR